MKKELKQLIKEKKYSDDQILKILSSYSEPPAESESDVMDEEDESEGETDSNESATAESQSAEKETVKKADIEKIVADAVAKALNAKKSEEKDKSKQLPKPSEKQKKTTPRPAVPPQETKVNTWRVRDFEHP
jgi:hypothetical protein